MKNPFKKKKKEKKKKELSNQLRSLIPRQIHPSIEKAAGKNLEKIYFFPRSSSPSLPSRMPSDCSASKRGKVEGHVNTADAKRV